MCNKSADNCANAIKFVPDWYRTQERCDKPVYDNPDLSDCHWLT